MPAFAADGDPAVPQRIVLFAPVGVGETAGLEDGASVRLARSMVSYMKRNRAEFNPRFSQTLSAADDAVWADGKPGQIVAGAHLTLLVSIDSMKNKADRFARGRKGRLMVCTMNVRALNPKDGEVWKTSVSGKVKLPKTGAAGDEKGVASFESKAAGKAADKAMNKFIAWLNNDENDYNVWRDPTNGGTKPPQLPLIDIKVSSTPEGAKIYVDGEFRGTTPTVVPMTARVWTMKIERSGYQPWVKELTPSPEMIIQPILQPIAGAQK
ncbi:MAG: PEGA domain-containing protein [Planctomycetes bacterium]|nr:PEGA domain-containing protein [Planctomycetota bacterium]